MVFNVFSVLLIAIVFLMFVLSLPTMIAAVDTTNSSALENESAAVKSVYSQLPLFFTVIIFAIGGIGIIVSLRGL